MNLKEKLQKALLDARAICDTAEGEKREFTPEERERVKAFMDEAAGLKAKIKAAEGDAEMRAMVAAMGFGMTDSKVAQPDPSMAGKGGTIGERFVNAQAYKEWIARFPNGEIPQSAKGIMSPPVEFKDLFGRKTLITGDSETSAGAFVETDYTGIYEPLGRRPLVLRDLVSKRTTDNDLVEFVRQTARVTQAAPVAEANVTTYSGATGEVEGKKPEGSLAFEAVTTPVRTIAVWVPATKRALSDVSQLRGIIDGELRDDLEEDLEDEMLSGDGTGEHLTGLLNTPNMLAQAWDTNLLTTIRKARTALRVLGHSAPTAILMHPNDAETLDLLQDGENRYYFGGPAEGGVQRVWRVPVVESEGMTEGVGLMGDFRKAVLWDRQRATISVSDSHSDFFIRNMVAILAEMRVAFGVIRPTAFIEVDLLAGS